MDLSDYFRHRERELRNASVAVDEIRATLAPDRKRGVLKGRVTLRMDSQVDAYLKVFERVALRRGGGYETTKYSYYLIFNGAEARGWEKDPTHDPPVHGHIGPGHKWTAAPEVTLEDALAHAWGEIHSWAEAEFDY